MSNIIKVLKILAISIAVFASALPAYGVAAFPGAEGAGKWTVGGRGGVVYEVTNLNDSGAGSLRAAIQATGPRIVVFRVSGTIALASNLTINNGYITIAGQTAPGDGICLRNYPLVVSANQVIVRFLRVRPSDNMGLEVDGISVNSGQNVILDHCSVSWGVDETLSTSTDTTGLDNVTVQWCIIAESLNCSVHSEGCHGFGTLAKGCFGSEYTYHHNLYAHQNNRNPYPGNYNDISVDPTGHTFDFRNNVIYNWGGTFAGYNTQAGANSLTKMNFVNNYYKRGPNSGGATAFFEDVFASKGYFSGNMMDGNTPADPWSLVLFDADWTVPQIDAFKQAQELAVTDAITMDDAQAAYDRVLDEVGAVLPKRDSADNRVINTVIDGSGSIIDDESQVGGFPVLASDTPPADTDHDGMSDSWESSHSLNPNDPADGPLDRDSDGYTNVEEYLNYLVQLGLNEPPSVYVYAGIDLTVALTDEAILDGTVTDDGLPNPPGMVTTSWTKQSGPGNVIFGNANVTDTTASFSAVGDYTLRLTADDGASSSIDEVTITVVASLPSTAVVQWDGGLPHQMSGSEVSNGRWEDAANWYSTTTGRNRTIPILGDTVRLHFPVTNDPPNPNNPNFNPESHITVDTVGVAKAGKIQTKEYTNSLTIQAGADFETRGNIEFYQDWTFNVHDLIVYGTLNACTNVGQVRIGGHQSFSYNNAYVYGVLNILGRNGDSALWIGYNAEDSSASIDHNRFYIYSTGIVTTDSLLMIPANDCLMDIDSGGKLVVKGNEQSKISGYVADGALTGDGQTGNINIMYYAVTDETVVQPTGVPMVNAGADQQIINPATTANLDGTVSGGSTQWTKRSGPGTVNFGNPSAVDTTVTFSAYGTYVLRLSATQNGKTGYDEVTIGRYETAPIVNQAPSVNAGVDQQVTLPNNITLDATVTDDGLPNPPAAVTTTWTKQSGPGVVTFSNIHAVDTTASFSSGGTYVLRLSADDSELTGFDDMMVAVGDSNQPPEPGKIDDYEGYGTPTTGGQGGTDIFVTNLNDSGAGSLEAALAQCDGTVPHMIKFQVGGAIGLQTELDAKSLVTIAGETAPAPGITLIDCGAYRALSIDCHDFIVRHIRIRDMSGEGIQIWGGHDDIIDRCSITGTGDGAIDMNVGSRFIMSRCLFGGCVEVHKAHCAYVSAHHSLYAWNNRRQPRIFQGGPYWDFRNNYVEYWTNSGTNILSSTAVNLINNYYGPPSPEASWSAAAFCAGQTDPATVYTHGNYCAGYNVDGVGTKPTPNTEPNVTTIAATEVPFVVLADCGAQPTDAIDQYYLDGGGLNPPPAPSCGGGGSGGGGAQWSESADYYVDGITGYDGNPGTSSQPWESLAKAVSTATAGKKVLVWGGQTYSDSLTFDHSGTSASPITFKRDPASGEAIIDGVGGNNGAIYSGSADYIVIDGFKITNGRYGIYLNGDGVDNWTIKNCRVTGNELHGIYIRSGDDHTLLNNIIYNTNTSGATAYSIYIYNGSTNVNVRGCDVHKGRYGISYEMSSSGYVKDSIVANATLAGINASSSTVTVTYSDVWGNNPNYSGVTPGTGCISSDPRWVDPINGNFTLNTGSPAHNTASDGGDMGYRVGGYVITNQAPSVNAGTDQVITLPAQAALDGTVTDDGLPNPPAAVTTTWTKQSGPGTVTFGNANAVDTTASFSVAGTYVLRLTANDSVLQAYDELTVTVNPGSVIFYSTDAKDGTLKESTETSGVGGNAYTGYTYIGDTSSKQQYLGILHFDTSSIPDGATITSATLSIRRLGKTGDPTSLGTITVDIKNGYYGTSDSLLAADFEAASSATNVVTLPYPAANGNWSSGTLNSSGRSNINKTGVTQFKVRFTTDDDNDGSNDYLSFYDNGDPPKLEVTWQ